VAATVVAAHSATGGGGGGQPFWQALRYTVTEDTTGKEQV
jgi:hypothetical protein